MDVDLKQSSDLARLSEVELRALADRLLLDEPAPTALCVAFVCIESHGMWHGRARAMMCRRMKHVRLGQDQQARLIDTIGKRLSDGAFSEQFKDQLRLALKLDSATIFEVCRRCQASPSPHVRRYAAWTLRQESS